MKQHWHKDHQGWSAGKKRGQPSWTKGKRLQAQLDQGYTRVYCQRLFGSCHGLQYFQVHGPSHDTPNVVPVDGEAAWAQVGKQIARAWESIKKPSAKHHPGQQERRGQTVVRVDAVVAVFSRHGEAQLVGMR